jgi:effector-binding domain-containing protein
MPKFHIDQFIIVNKPIGEVHRFVSDFHSWTEWSPWLIADQDAKVNVNEDGKYYEWTGPVSGDGNMNMLAVTDSRIDIDLTFLKPWKSKAKVWFLLKEVEGGTELRWLMDSSLPFFMFFMLGMFKALIAMDFDRGLRMLKEKLEEGVIHSKLTFVGPNTFRGGDYIGIKTITCPRGIAEAMKKDYTKLLEYVKREDAAQINGNPFSIYHKWDPAKGIVEYTAAVPVSGEINLLDGMFMGNYPSSSVFTTHHKGNYVHIGNAWSAMYARKQNKIFKSNKNLDPVEEYLNSPNDTPVNDLEANIHFVIKQ